MKIRLLSLVAFCALVAFARLQAEETPNAPKAAETTKSAKPKVETELSGNMEEIGKAFRRLNRQIGDAAKNEESLTLIASIRERAEASLKLEPAKKAEIPAEQQAKFVAAYRAKMKDFLGNLGKLEAALKAGDNAQAEALVKTLKQDQKEGHKEFKIEEKKS